MSTDIVKWFSLKIILYYSNYNLRGEALNVLDAVARENLY